MRDAAGDPDSRTTFERSTQRTVPDEGECALTSLLERSCEAQHVLALGEPAEAEKGGPVTPPAEATTSRLGIARCEALEVDAAVDDLRLPHRIGNGRLEAVAKPLRHGDDDRGSPYDVARRGAGAAYGPDVRDVLSVRRDDERGPCRDGRGKARRNEEVRVRDVRPEVSRGTDGVAEEREVPPSSSASVDDGPRNLVPAREELALEVSDEDAEIGVVSPRVHLGDEEDPQWRYPRVTWRIPRHISSVVPSPHRT